MERSLGQHCFASQKGFGNTLCKLQGPSVVTVIAISESYN